MAWGYGTTVEDAESYEGPENDYSGFVGGGPATEATPVDPNSSPVRIGPLQQERISDKFSFYLDEDIGQFGVRFESHPFGANVNVGQGGQFNWEGNVSEQIGPFGARIGLLGQGTSGSVSPYADLNVNPLPGLNLNLYGQSYPGGYSQLSPSASYQTQFNTPSGPLEYSIGRQGGRTVGNLQMRGDF